MKTGLTSIALVVACAIPSLAAADALPNCPPGTHMVTNPVPEGALHHAGAECVEDEGGGSGCSASPGRGGLAPSFAVLGLAALLARRRRRRAG